LLLPVHGTDHVAVGDAVQDGDVVLQTVLGELAAVPGHGDDVLFGLDECGLFGAVEGDEPEPATHQEHEEQHPAYQFGPNRDFCHGMCLRIV
jgi:hypothetical protein